MNNPTVPSASTAAIKKQRNFVFSFRCLDSELLVRLLNDVCIFDPDSTMWWNGCGVDKVLADGTVQHELSGSRSKEVIKQNFSTLVNRGNILNEISRTSINAKLLSITNL